jgi:lipocalin
LYSRPIIKEEDLKQMDEIVRDNGWATADDIDYKYVIGATPVMLL